jgi:hypothetical protein
LALALEPGRERMVEQPPLPPDAPILDRDDWHRIARDGLIMAGASGAAAIVGGPLSAFAAIGATQFGYASTCRAPDSPSNKWFGAMLGGSVALHALAVAAAPVRSMLRVAGAPSLALASFALGLGTPLYLGWRRRADFEIVRTKGDTP